MIRLFLFCLGCLLTTIISASEQPHNKVGEFSQEKYFAGFTKPFISSGRQERPIMRRDIYRMTLHVNFVGTSTAVRVPPSIKRIELWGPDEEGV